MVAGVERRGTGQLSREQSAREWHARQKSDALRQCGREEFLGGFLTKNIEDDLNGLDVRIPHRLQRFVYGLDADAVVPEFARTDQIIEIAEHFRPVEDGRVRTVQLQQID